MKIKLWGTRGSLACSTPECKIYGGETSCVEVSGSDNTLLVLDAGTGIRKLGKSINKKIGRIDILLTHLHLDHIQGLGFFLPFFDPKKEIHVYGPASSDRQLLSLLTKYLSPPLFPVLVRDFSCRLYLHAMPKTNFKIGEFQISSQAIIHPGNTVGYRITSPFGTLAYLPDHEPALGSTKFPMRPDWTSGYDLVANADLLIHDSQYTNKEYQTRMGWGHSTILQALQLAQLAKVKNFITFHHDPAHSDKMLDAMLASVVAELQPDIHVYPGREGFLFDLEKIKQTTLETI